jgi:3-hydroxyisobutyrate dehydrogenase-like beta-hydroxyacid dehydrogenase
VRDGAPRGGNDDAQKVRFDMATISVLGAGRMGAALVTAFVKAGHDVTVWNRTAAKADALRARGARVAASLAEAAHADVVVGIVSDYEVSEALRASPGFASALRGKTYVELASGTPRNARRSAAWAKEHGIDYLDGAIMATPDVIAQPGCTILYAGPTALFDAHAPTLRALGDGTMHVGVDVGHANGLDNAILVVLWGAVHGALQGAALCEAEKLPLETFAQALRGAWPIVEPVLQDALARIGARRWTPDASTAASVSTCHASVRYVLEMSRENGVNARLPEALDDVFSRAIAAGHAEDDLAVVYTSLR